MDEGEREQQPGGAGEHGSSVESYGLELARIWAR